MNKTNTRKALNPAYRKHKPLRKDVNNFVEELKQCLHNVKSSDNNGESEEHIKSHFIQFFKNTFYKENYINTKERIDLAIYTGKTVKSEVSVIIEAKKPSNKSEFLTESNLNRKALQELLLYYLRERLDNGNNNIKHLVATNGYEWYLFKAEDFYNYFYKNKSLLKEYKAFRDGLKDTSKNELFYNEIAKKYIAEVEQEFPFVHLDFTKTNFDNLSDTHLNTLFKIFSNVHLLGHSFGNDSNQLNKTFYNELLHIIGLEEVKDKGKKVISRKSEKDRDYASLLESTVFHLEDRDYIRKIQSIENNNEKAFNAGLELCLTWVNRILFLKLLESQLLAYHNNNPVYKFLNSKFINGYDDLNDLFFSALAKIEEERHPRFKDKYKHIPYLNSSLFERSILEDEAFEISALNNDDITIYNGTVLKDANGKKQKGKLKTLDYLFQFLEAYDFATDGNEGIEDAQETKSLINASVLGLIFEKINGYKEGSFYTPAYITMYMCRETLRRAIIQKFKEKENDQIETFEDLQSYCQRYFKIDDLKRFNTLVNSLRICDPAVGSGHFLVSALNELIVIKNELGILVDAKGLPLRCDIEIVNDELYVIDDNGSLFEYEPTKPDKARIQHTLFHEKQTLIENCLFGVDINPNSVKICRLRLWIELLKNAYYTKENRLQTLPNIDINIKCGNSLISRFSLEDDLKDAFKGKEVNYSFKDYKNAVAEYKDANNKERKREVLEIIEEVKHNFKSTLDNKFIQKFQKAQGEFINEEERLKNLKAFGENIKKAEKEKLKKLKDKAEATYLEQQEIVNNVIYHNAFEWRFEFPEVLAEDGSYIGFDAIIGNPPYFGLSNEPIFKNKYFNERYSTLKCSDIYALFCELAYSILSTNGLNSFIISNKWLRASYGESLRSFFLTKMNPIVLIDFGQNLVFDNAIVHTSIIELQKANNNNSIVAVRYKDEDAPVNTSLMSYIRENRVEGLQLTSDIWNIVNQDYSKLNKKISGFKKLKNFDVRINYGIKTGFNEAFIIDEEQYEKLLQEESKNKEIIKPILRGRDTRKYYCNFSKLYMICTFPSLNIDIDEYKSIKNHLSKFLPKLNQTGEVYINNIGEKDKTRKRTPNKWFEVQDTVSYYSEFEQPKIIFSEIVSQPQFYYDEMNYYPEASSFSISGEKLKFITALLNSKFVTFLFKHFYMGGELVGKIRYKKMFLEQVPIPYPNEFDEKIINEKVDEIISIKKENLKADTTTLEKEIDQMVYKLYGLTEEEIAIVENSQ